MKSTYKLFVAFFLIFSASRCAYAGDQVISDAPATVSYIVRSQAGEHQKYAVTLSFPGMPTGTTGIGIPTSYASATGAEKGIQNLRVLTPGAKLLATNDASRMSVEHQPSERITVLYDFVPIDRSVPGSSSRTQFLPVMQATYLHWMGPTSWVFPLIPSRGNASINFEDLDESWTVASSFGNSRLLTFKWNPNTLLQSLVVAGDFRLTTKRSEAGGSRVTFAVRGDWPIPDDNFASSAVKIIDGQRRFWNDSAQGDFLVVLAPLELNGPSTMVGVALLNSFTTFVTPDNSQTRIQHTWAHETFHQWLPRAFGGLENPQARLFWFSEGFTEYFANVLMLRGKLMGLNDFVAEINGALHKLAASHHAALSNDEVAARFGLSPNIQLLAYRRGMLLAANWDSDIRAASNGKKSLDDAIRWLLTEQRKTPGIRLNRQLIEAMASQFGVPEPKRDIELFIESAQPIRVRLSGSLPCVSVATVDAVIPDPGFNLPDSELNSQVSGLVEGNAAYKAGLRNGQKLLQSPKPIAGSSEEIVLKVLVEGEIKELRYVPDGVVRRQTQELKVLSDSTCAAFSH